MNEYSDKIASMIWSYSRLSAFEQCKYAFFLKYIVEDDDAYLAEGNYWADVGSFMHEILEKVFKGELKMIDASGYFIDHFDENVTYDAPPAIKNNTYNACLEYLVNEDLNWMNQYEILGVELEVHFELEGYQFKGFIDLLMRDRQTGKIVALDHKSAAYPLSSKTGKVLKAHEKSFSSYKKQMYLYSYAVKQLYGEFPEWIIWNHFKAGRLLRIQFDENEYREAINWFVDTIQAVENEGDFTETIDYFYCTNLCDFRNSCEYKLYKGG